MTVRRALADQAAVLAAIHADAFDRPWRQAEIAELLARPEVFALAMDEGFILMQAAGGETEVLTLAVRRSARRNGIGRRLLEAALTESAARGAESAFLEVASDNAVALGLYQAAGFRQVGRRKGYYSRRQGAADALVLRRDLSPASG
ncbi:MAG TPA: ribosomal protein S18-alanine N-acetyltransferase [Caulobacteraceae bacterium]|nr:ribosomal protein S18-alanine N-acetyltransferase [Caulobacteraceae bacterium]